MKTRLMTNPERTSYRLDVIVDGKLNQYFFNNEQDALDFQNGI